MRARLRSSLLVQALIRRAHVLGCFAAVLHKGEEDRGAVMLVITGRDGAIVYEQATALDGARAWRAAGDAGLAQADIDGLVARRRKFDGDLWVLEIDDRDGVFELDEPVLA